MTLLQQALQDRFGEHRVQEFPTAEGEIPLLIIELELRSKITVVMTNGLSDFKMDVNEKLKGREYNELYFCLPSYWDWDALDNPQMNWVYPWIQRIAKHPIEKNTWYAPGHTLPAGKEMNPLSTTMKQNSFLLSDPLLLEEHLKALELPEKTIYFLAIIPLFKEELDYKIARGTFKFLRKMASAGVSEKLDDYRGSVLKRHWKRLR